MAQLDNQLVKLCSLMSLIHDTQTEEGYLTEHWIYK